jgi:hypothetical protein
MLFADPNIGRDAVYIADGSAPVLVRVVARRRDAITDFGDARLWSETTRIDLRVAEVPNPRPGDRIEIDGDAFLIQGEPVRDTCRAGAETLWAFQRGDQPERIGARQRGLGRDPR